MIVLDTNVISELLTPAPSPGVERWLSVQPPMSVFTTTITQAEILYGLRLLPSGRRRRDLEAAVLPIFEEDLAGRILTFDSDAADSYATLATARRQMGRPISQPDAQIAAICRLHDAVCATRNGKDFVHTGIELVDPWSEVWTRASI